MPDTIVKNEIQKTELKVLVFIYSVEILNLRGSTTSITYQSVITTLNTI